MSTDRAWEYDADELTDALSHWLAGGPSDTERENVNTHLSKLLTDPSRLGVLDDPESLDPDQEYRSRVPETDVVIAYVLDPCTLRILSRMVDA